MVSYIVRSGERGGWFYFPSINSKLLQQYVKDYRGIPNINLKKYWTCCVWQNDESFSLFQLYVFQKCSSSKDNVFRRGTFWYQFIFYDILASYLFDRLFY